MMRRGMLVGAALFTVALGLIFRSEALLEAWLLAFIGLTGFAAGSLGLLMIAHLLGEYWLEPVRNELEAATLTLPLLALLALPLTLGLDQLYPWAPSPETLQLPPLRAAYLEPAFFLVRGGVYLAVWIGLAFLMTRPGELRGASAIGLALLAPTATLAAIDWVMSRDPRWWSSLFGFVFALSQLLPALAAAVLADLVSPQRPDAKRLRSLERALITLALLTLWLWFVQFLVIWMANLPEEAVWYLHRNERFSWLMFGIVIPAMLGGIALLLPPRVGGALMITGCVLLLAQHVGHMIWLIRPSAQTSGAPLVEAAVVVGLGALWAAWFADGLWRRSKRDEAGEVPISSPAR